MPEPTRSPIYGRIVAILIAVTVLAGVGMAFYVLFPR